MLDRVSKFTLHEFNRSGTTYVLAVIDCWNCGEITETLNHNLIKYCGACGSSHNIRPEVARQQNTMTYVGRKVIIQK